jgi:31-O-methyltransferase
VQPTGPPQGSPAETREPTEFLLSNGSTLWQLNQAETVLQYRKIVDERMYSQYGITVRPGDTVFDVGANIGISALYFHWQAEDVRVFAFEPAGPMFRALEHNLRDHGVRHVAGNVALGAEPGTTHITLYPNNTSMSSVYADVDHDRDVTRTYLRNIGFSATDVEDITHDLHVAHVQDCAVTTVSAVLDEHEVDRVDLLKVNVEKAELDVLAGIRAEHWPIVRQAVVQVHDIEGRVQGVRAQLHELGFHTALSQDQQLATTDIFDVFAWRHDRPEAGRA